MTFVAVLERRCDAEQLAELDGLPDGEAGANGAEAS
jgi:hypothetical protein